MHQTYRFGIFEFDTKHFELRRDGQSSRLQRQPARVLAILIEHAGQLVSRDDLRRAIWGDDTFVDFDRGLNFCIAQIRTALGDDAGTPRVVRTVPTKGYQFVCPVEKVVPTASRAFGRRAAIAAAALVVVAAALLAVYARGTSRSGRPIVAVVRFDNETGDAELTRFSDYLTDSVVEQLTVAGEGSYEVVGNAAILRGARAGRDLGAIAASLHANYVVFGQVQRDANHVRVLGHLIRLPDQTHVTVARFDDISAQTLASTHEIAVRMTEKFVQRLKDPGLRTSHVAASR
jgi:DNA-binding winged helix-turn-helix (wHTH) protein